MILDFAINENMENRVATSKLNVIVYTDCVRAFKLTFSMYIALLHQNILICAAILSFIKISGHFTGLSESGEYIGSVVLKTFLTLFSSEPCPRL